jgi:hypothetical protein
MKGFKKYKRKQVKPSVIAFPVCTPTGGTIEGVMLPIDGMYVYCKFEVPLRINVSPNK